MGMERVAVDKPFPSSKRESCQEIRRVPPGLEGEREGGREGGKGE